MQREPEHLLLERARAGDRAALDSLLKHHQAQIYRFGMQMCRDPEDASDVLQDTLLAMARNVKDFRGASSVSTWLYSIARSFCIKKRRKSKFAPSSQASLDSDLPEQVAQLAAPTLSPDDALASKQVAHALDVAIGALEPMYREVLVLRDIEGLTAPEVAEVLEISVQAVKSRLHRARRAVRDYVAPLLGIGADPPPNPGSCPDVLSLYSQHLEGDISATLCAEMEQHLAACAACRGTCDSLKHTLALCRTTAPLLPVPDAVQAAVKVALRNWLVTTP